MNQHGYPLFFFLTWVIGLSFTLACEKPNTEERYDSDNWEIVTIDQEGKTGLYSQLKLNTANSPIIAYHSEDEGCIKVYDGNSIHKIGDSVLNSYGMFLSMEMYMGSPILSFYDFDFTYKTDLRSILQLTDPKKQLEKYQEIMLRFLTENRLVVYNVHDDAYAVLDIGGGLYSSMEIDRQGIAMIAYASYLPGTIRQQINALNIPHLDPNSLLGWMAEQNTTGASNGSFLNPDAASNQVNFQTRFYPTFLTVDTQSLELVTAPMLIEAVEQPESGSSNVSDKDQGVSMQLKALTDDHLICAYVNTSDFTIHAAQSWDKGISWEVFTVPSKDKVGDFLAIDARTFDDQTSVIGIVYFAISTGNLNYVMTEDFGNTWSETYILDDPTGKEAGWYPQIYLGVDKSAFISYYFNDSPRSLQFIEFTPTHTILQEQIDTKSCSNGRFNSLMVDESHQIIYISYFDKCLDNLSSSYALKMAKRSF